MFTDACPLLLEQCSQIPNRLTVITFNQCSQQISYHLAVIAEPVFADLVLVEPVFTDLVLVQPVFTDLVLVEPVFTDLVLVEPVFTHLVLLDRYC